MVPFELLERLLLCGQGKDGCINDYALAALTAHQLLVDARAAPEPSELGVDLPRYEDVYDKSLHRDIMVPSEGGEWARLEDFRIYVMPFISGYLREHIAMLEANAIHPQIVTAIRRLKMMVERF
jgi:hypothetical protein